MHRFFVTPDAIRAGQATLSGPVAHQIARVLRLRRGDHIVLLDDSGLEYTFELQVVDPEQVKARALRRETAAGEPQTQITLYQALLKGERFEWVLQKGTELGITGFVPLLCERNVVRDPAVAEKKGKRWRAIIREAAEQSHRGRLPRLELPLPFGEACRQAGAAAGLALLAWEGETSSGLKETLREGAGSDQQPSVAVKTANGPDRPFRSDVQLLVGPEGGFTPGEVELARTHSIRAITLGRRILRAETAGIVAAAAVLYESGDLG
jgi:16S rRNA (uracil1498-N3)-methyltransferase